MIIKTKDGGSVALNGGLCYQFNLTVKSLNDKQELETTSVQLTNAQGYELAMEILKRLEVR